MISWDCRIRTWLQELISPSAPFIQIQHAAVACPGFMQADYPCICGPRLFNVPLVPSMDAGDTGTNRGLSRHCSGCSFTLSVGLYEYGCTKLFTSVPGQIQDASVPPESHSTDQFKLADRSATWYRTLTGAYNNFLVSRDRTYLYVIESCTHLPVAHAVAWDPSRMSYLKYALLIPSHTLGLVIKIPGTEGCSLPVPGKTY
ncbi:uncharacterized protein EDB93DRAFT_316371 [Suillus bovinus]|uniref:uncharacterized protein n=1 Tax=Suillus bovinus TaxID=48563 RepID=UPI001B87E11D|nr:uncharacterized protein EDB93DRAFT_316371 [Suillus bovinus]KAG2151009.1 hypothetical protein EDB93DRAFT_316371 [Suillus bovinus]